MCIVYDSRNLTVFDKLRRLRKKKIEKYTYKKEKERNTSFQS